MPQLAVDPVLAENPAEPQAVARSERTPAPAAPAPARPPRLEVAALAAPPAEQAPPLETRRAAPSPRAAPRPRPPVKNAPPPPLAVPALAAPSAPEAPRSARKPEPPAAPRKPPASAPRPDEPQLAGVPLGSLSACVSDAQELKLKQALLSAIGSRSECSSRAGSWRFLQTRNLNSFLVWVERAPQRAAGDRCSELSHAIACVENQGGRVAAR
jgi:hypothetical protein